MANDEPVGERYSILHGRYRIQSFIGRGGMASVYRARDEALGRDVAIKLFEAHPEDSVELAREHHELAVLASLNHPSLVTLHDAGIDRTDPANPRRFLVMELVQGANLKQALAGGALPLREVAQIGYDLAEGLEYVHHHDVIHRDVKPANILLADYIDHGVRTRAKLADFGISQSSADFPTNERTATGTAAYLSPEQASGKPLGTASDVYSLGLVLIECVTGTRVFHGSRVQAALARLVDDPVVPTDLPPNWQALLTGMTAREPQDRPMLNDIILFFRRAFLVETSRHGIAHGEEPDAAHDSAGDPTESLTSRE